MSLRLSELLQGIVAIEAARDCIPTGLTQDSREVKAGDVFVALAGARHNADSFIDDALRRGASAVLSETPSTNPRVVNVPRLRTHLGIIANRFYGAPSHRLLIIGVTGTNGKTTCTQLLAQLLDRPDARCGIIGTLGSGFPGALAPGMHTTPDVVRVHRTMAQLLQDGAAAICMEVSSHALDQGRVDGVAFDIAVFTNLTRDHLDYHGDMARYADAKRVLFAMPGLSAAVINRDDAFGQELIGQLRARVTLKTYGIDAGDVHARNISPRHDGMHLDAITPAGTFALDVPLLGRFNASNVLAVTATLLAAGRLNQEMASRMRHLRAPAGRMERFGGGARPLVVVDYAHTPDALEKVLSALRDHVQGALWCVFGCGGNRDRGKRPLMGAIAERLADHVVVTDDNPRNEAPDTIVAEIAAGMQRKPRVIRDRAKAIRAAVTEAAAADIVLIAGKGHEDYQEIEGQRYPFSDRTEVEAALRQAA